MPTPQNRRRISSGPVQIAPGNSAGSIAAYRGVALRRFAHAVLASLLGIAVPAADPALAQTCFTLQAELSHLQSQGGGGGRARYDRAWREQANVLARTESR